MESFAQMMNCESQLTFDLSPMPPLDRRREMRSRTAPIPARLTDLYRERVNATLINISQSGLGLKVDERFIIDFPVLVEYDGLFVLGNVRHCLKANAGGYILGIKVTRVVVRLDARVYRAACAADFLENN
jgi:hypothetical protein